MVEVKLLEKNFYEYSKSFIIEYKVDGIKYLYDLRLKLDKMNLFVTGFGVKTGRQRDFRYSKIEDYSYRSLNLEEKREYELNYYKNNIPKEVVNLAFSEFIKSIKYEEY